jgi:amidohydrolase
MLDFSHLVDAIVPGVVGLRREIHAHPELGFEETQTARRVVDQLSPLGTLDIQTGVAGTGVVAVLNGSKPGPCVGLRADMDALPLQEQSDVSYASTVAGKMHACGHDGHTACLVGAAKVLSQVADALPGKVKFIFQPAEEGGGGGRLMCEQGVLDGPKVEAVFAMHGWPAVDFGHVGVREGPFMASADFWEVTIRGRGGHAGYPHRAVDPIVAASHVVLALQTIAARETNPLDSVVVTVARLTAGSAMNVIPDTA